jgi:hypothetical protein
MTVRAVLLGLLCAAVLCGVTYFNDFVLLQSHMVGSFMPISVFGGLILFVLLINPLLGRIRKGLALRGAELAVVMALTFVSCYVPGRGLMHYFTTFLMMPHQYQNVTPGWKQEGAVQLVPPRMLADPSRKPEEALSGFLTGLSKGGRSISPEQVPWDAWWGALGFWVPLLVSISIGLMGLALVVHGQWSKREQLRYPIVTFANALLPREGQTISSLFKSRAFWISAGAVIVIHVNNYGYVWFPERMVRLPIEIDFRIAGTELRTFVQGGGNDLLLVQFYFTAIGFAYLLATDLSCSLGIAPYLYTYVVGICVIHGIPIRDGGFMSLKIESFLHGGAFVGMFLVLLYTGRRYYLCALRQALFLRSPDPVPPHAVWGIRVFLLGGALFTVQLVLVGLEWQLAVLYTLGATLIFTVISRLVAETGLFYLHAYHFPCVILWGFMGTAALGPKAMLIMLMVSSLLLIDPREAVMPFTVNGLKLADMNRVPLGRTAGWGMVALVVAFAVAIPATLYWQYNHGVNQAADGWTRGVPTFALNEVVRARQDLRLVDRLDFSNSLSGWQRFAEISPNRQCVTAFGIALGLVLVFTAARFRFPGWPLHPVMFLVLGTWQSRRMGASFLLGGLIKFVVTKLLGGKGYEKLKPAMFGLIAGDMFGGIAIMIIGAIYYFSTGKVPEAFRILPN